MSLSPTPNLHPKPNHNPTSTLTSTLTLPLIRTLAIPLTRFIMEPGFILILITLPCICNNQFVDTLNDRLGDIGCDVSIFLG